VSAALKQRYSRRTMTDRAKLLQILRTASASLPGVVEKKMFGCEALFTTGRIFALVWKTGRIGLKLPAPDRYAALASQRGAAPWMVGTKVMGRWVLVPPKLEHPKALAPWLKEAHAMAGMPPAKPMAKKTSTKNAATKKASAKKMSAKKAGPKKVGTKKPKKATARA
jgi:hypothetical protein